VLTYTYTPDLLALWHVRLLAAAAAAAAALLVLPLLLLLLLLPLLLLLCTQRQLERGVAWPTPGSKFWEQAPRGTPMPVDVGAGKNSLVQPRDSRCLDIVHFTAELAPIAKVREGL